MSEEAPEPDRVAGHPHPRETRALHGQAAAERAFLAAWAEGRLPHGWLLRGPRGVGKATLAYRIARALIAGGPGGLADAVPASLDPPEGCKVAARIRAQAEPRLRVLRRTVNEKTGRLRTQILVDDVRAVRRFLSLSIPDGGWRAVIADPADEMNASAANALLKVLEEPPVRTALMLVAHVPSRLLPTIRSRCRNLDLRPLGPADLAAALAGTGVEVGPDEAATLAVLAGGSVGEALRLAAGGGVALYGRIVGALGEGRGIDRARMVALADEAGRRGAEELYALAGRLILTLVGRLARHGVAEVESPEAAPGEAALMAAVARSPAQAALWAEASARVGAALSHARAVNLDPGLTIIDTFLDLDATLARAREAG
ncbi:MAG TPA: DNA polymerase III subunit delta' [Thermohalobaculum sp.]|nr:DNA polymerase III subunit delta' [Thermohalobaculum sp.]